ncbi:CDP-diacylglycerol--glycerol-3-phosphate 3-phosphatidyltransferase [Mesomycoplasma moatsii]|uniref:CDP-diacylglycerol--glycerol-3-phosphate 3-phosphatidyltransferase n=1 Tax=Mesomycoplasma moatsii TaxID=171287 RepID=UPI0003B38741
MNLPNKLTILRIVLVIPLIILFCLFIWYASFVEDLLSFKDVDIHTKSQYFLYAIGIVFILSMITDFIDGRLARKNNQITTFGKLFDPLADKIIISTILIFLSFLSYTYLILVVIFIMRDLIVDGFRNLSASNNLKVEASIYGKLKTIFQSIAIPMILFLIPIINANVWWHLFLLNLPMIIAVLMSLFSGWMYFRQVLPLLKKDK